MWPSPPSRLFSWQLITVQLSHIETRTLQLSHSEMTPRWPAIDPADRSIGGRAESLRGIAFALLADHEQTALLAAVVMAQQPKAILVRERKVCGGSSV